MGRIVSASGRLLGLLTFGALGALAALTALIAGCAGSSSTPKAEDPPTLTTLTQESAILIDERGVVAQSLGTNGPATTVEPDIRFAGALWPSPDRSRVAVAIESGGNSKLAYVDADGSFREIHAARGDASYSVAWSPSGDSLLFGFSGGNGKGLAVAALNSQGAVTDVGCSVSDEALSWGRGDLFVVGDGINHYVVERSDCGTIESIDARKLHEVVFGPRGYRVAYILRELAYDREAREYRPDSSLYVADAIGTDPILVVGNRYRPHRPAWSPDASLLAYDARLPEDEGRRLISIFDVADRRSTFLNPEAVDSKLSEWGPQWSPSGVAIAYMQVPRGKDASVVVRALDETFTKSIGKPGEELVGWLDDHRLILRGPQATRIVTIDGRESLVVSGASSILALRESDIQGTE